MLNTNTNKQQRPRQPQIRTNTNSSSSSSSLSQLKQSQNNSNILSILLLILCSWSIKLLLIPAYYSTDFAVHQNWLRITHTLPLSQWYYDSVSKWTLDYPPIFAYFQYLLSIIANILSPAIVSSINQLKQTIYFQRISVIITDIPYLYTLLILFKYKICLPLVIAYLWIPLILLDNVHFQYNVIMQALLILSVIYISRKKYLKGAFLYALLLNFKHIYLYCAPAFFIYLLRQYIFNKQHEQQHNQTSQMHQEQNQGLTAYQLQNTKQQNITKDANNTSKQSWITKLTKTAIVTLIPFVISFGPFLIVGGVEGVKQIFARLFPFSRGLVHDYWAPNFWALYYFVDKILAMLNITPKILSSISEAHPQKSNVNMLKVLPQISPNFTIFAILLFLLPIIVTYFISKKSVPFPKLVCLCGFVFFIFGFHVHQKAIVPYINLLFLFHYYNYDTNNNSNINTNTNANDEQHEKMEILGLNAAVFVNIVNLIPLLIQPQQKLLCIALCALWIIIWDHLQHNNRQHMIQIQQSIIKQFNMHRLPQIVPLYIQYLIQITGIFIVVFYLYIHPIMFRNKPSLEFVPLMINSVWAAVFNILWIGWMYVRFVYQYAVKREYNIGRSQI